MIRCLLLSSLSLLGTCFVELASSAEDPRDIGSAAELLPASVVVYGESSQPPRLSDNREQLVARSMLEKGQSQEAARSEIQLLLELIPLAHEVSLTLDTADGQLQLQLGLQLENPHQ